MLTNLVKLVLEISEQGKKITSFSMGSDTPRSPESTKQSNL